MTTQGTSPKESQDDQHPGDRGQGQGSGGGADHQHQINQITRHEGHRLKASNAALQGLDFKRETVGGKTKKRQQHPEGPGAAGRQGEV